MPNMLLYILVAAGVTYAVRVLPLTLLRRPITSPFLQSFLYYVPYVTLSVMTFPAMVDATQSPIAGYGRVFRLSRSQPAQSGCAVLRHGAAAGAGAVTFSIAPRHSSSAGTFPRFYFYIFFRHQAHM